jgi:2-desacetyl-2-hydroxyethyl bacteriochlorophyllide A dehydrogenase
VHTVDALVCAEPGRLLLEQRPVPRPAPGEALVRPLRVGICGTDYHIYEGNHPYLEYPRVLGHELAVEIVEPGDSPDLKASAVCVVNPYVSCGQCVACRNGKPNCCVRIAVLGVHRDGGMTGLLAVPTGNLIPAPDLTPDQCAVVEFLAIGAHAVRRGSVSQRDRVLVVGAGPIGLGVALVARRAGASVVVHDRDADRLVSAGAIAGVQTVPPDVDPVGAGLPDAAGFDVVFDATGNARSMEKAFDYVAHGGRYVLVSVVKEPITFMDPDFHRKEMTLLGSRNATAVDFQAVIAAIREGAIPIDRLVTHRTSLAGAIRDIPRWTTEKAGLIKAVVDLD